MLGCLVVEGIRIVFTTHPFCVNAYGGVIVKENESVPCK